MRRHSARHAVLLLKVFVIGVVAFAAAPAIAQKNEHYGSPLYAPRYYDPNETVGSGLPPALQKVGIEQRLGGQLPLDAEFKDEDERIVKLGDLFKSGRPVILALVYFECPMLCNEVLNGLTGSLKGISLNAGKEFDVIAISFDARENAKPGLAKNKKAAYMERYARAGTERGWHFLTGPQGSIDKVTQAAGFNYHWDEKSGQFAHAGGIMITTPGGKLSRYMYGIDYSPRDIKFAVMESAEARVGNPAEQLLLYCYHYDPSTGKYGLAILNVIRLGGIATLIAMGAMFFVFRRRNKHRNANANDGPGSAAAGQT